MEFGPCEMVKNRGFLVSYFGSILCESGLFASACEHDGAPLVLPACQMVDDTVLMS